MHKGTVKWFNVKKGYGFIQSDAASKDIFVHVTSLQQSGIRKLSDGQMVSFDIFDDKGRPAANHISIIQLPSKALKFNPRSQEFCSAGILCKFFTAENR